jgi:hypothetical protein
MTLSPGYGSILIFGARSDAPTPVKPLQQVTAIIGAGLGGGKKKILSGYKCF